MRTLVHRTLAVALLVASVPVETQVTRIDEGSFTITQNGERIGREQFIIRSLQGEIQASATVAYGDRRVTPKLSSDSTGTPLVFDVEIKSAAGVDERYQGKLSGGRVSARIYSARGQAGKEYVVAQGALVIDDEVFHQYYFLAKQNRQGSVPVVIPRRNTQIIMRVTSAGTDRVTIGSRTLEAEKLVLREPDGAEREVWVDAEGRVLKVSIPARGIVALRDDPPR